MVQKAAKRKVVTRKTGASVRRQKVAIVVSQFNQDVCDGLLNGALKALKGEGYKQNEILICKVAGAVEIPLVTQTVLKKKKAAGVITLGCVIRGDTAHFEYVCRAVNDGCMRVQLDLGKPVTFGVITVENEKQAIERSQDNQYNKGREAALALLDSFATLKNI